MGFLRDFEAMYSADARKAFFLEWITNRRNELFKELRAQAPILDLGTFEDPDSVVRSLLVVSRYEDVRTIIVDKEHFNVKPYADAGSQDFILGMEGQAHDEGREILEKAILQTDQETIRTLVAEEAKALIETALAQGSLNLPVDFSRHIPLRLAARYFGVPDPPDPETLNRWTLALARAFTYEIFTRYFVQDLGREMVLGKLALQARKEGGDYLGQVIAEGKVDHDTVLGRMLAPYPNSGTLPTQEEMARIIRLIMGSINGMIENVNRGVNKAMNVLLSYPHALAGAITAAQNDDEKLLTQYIWEALRFDVPAPQFLLRDCCKAWRLKDGTIIPEGARILAALCSVMMDEEQVRDHPAEEFHLGRGDVPDLHFGEERHSCLGRGIAQVQLVEMCKHLLRLPGIRRALGQAGELHYDGLLPTSFTIVWDRPPYAVTQKSLPQPTQLAQPVQSPLTAIMTIKSPQELHFRALQTLLDQKFLEVKALLDQVGTVHFARFVFLDNNSKLALITTYDGPFEKYIKNYIEIAGPLFNTMLAHIEDAPPLPVQRYRDEFVEYVRHVNLESAGFYSAYPTLTVQDIRSREDGRGAQPSRTLVGDAAGQSGDKQKKEPEIIPLPKEAWSDIQGLILRNYHMPLVRHFILQIDNVNEARRFIGGLVNSAQDYPQITTANKEWQKGQAPAYCLNIGFTYAGLKALQLSDSSLASFSQSRAFVAGAVARAEDVGDTGESAPDHWDPSLRNADAVHILLSLHARGDEELAAHAERLEKLFPQHALKKLQSYDGQALPGGKVHFGYTDGISQPTIAGVEPEFRDSSPPVPPGAFLLGYPSQWTNFQYPVPRPLELGRNGSFGAFRILKQDVTAFEQYLKNTVQQLKQEYRNLDMDEEKLAAKLCGRWRNGVPLALSPDSANTDIPQEQWNDFTYVNDKEGYGCPFGSHMRRTNPRGESEKVAGIDGHQRRIIRRGMPYGPPYQQPDGKERGLLGMFICVSLEDQFEFLMANWINKGGFRAGVPTGAMDPLFGSDGQGTQIFSIPTKQHSVFTTGFQQFVTTRGGVYCFLPSITALGYIANL